jgi:putative membrane protein
MNKETDMMWDWHTGWSWWGWLGMSVFMVIFWGLVIWGIVVLVRYLSTPEQQTPSSHQPSTSPDTILAERFARGEIDEREYVHKHEILQSGDPDARSADTADATREREGETVAR